MATPRRTSARIRAKTPGKTPEPISALGSLIERDESPGNQQSLNAAVHDQRIGHIPGAFESDSFLLTPSARTEPDHENMHPSKVQQSTTKSTDQGLVLGFSDIKDKERPAALENTPSKSKLASAGFDFKFANADNDLTAETQRIMESVREEAARIKDQMRRERDEQTRKDEEAGLEFSDRRIAQPKTKTGRFSNAHKSQFSKMDSIANHPSVWKHKSAVIESVQPQSLKRTQSKAELVEERIENPAPSKRAKASSGDDVSAARPVSRDGSNIPRLPTLPTVVTTPTKASLARSASIKSLRNTKIPGLLHSKSTKELVRSKEHAEESSTRSLFGLKKSISMKSILAKPQPKYSDDPVKIAAGTHLPLQDQPSSTPVKAIKRVGFAEDLTSPTPTRPTGLKMPTKVLTPFRRADAPINNCLTSSPSRSVETTPSGSVKTRQEVIGTSPSKATPTRPTVSLVRSAPSTPSEIRSDPVAISSPSPRKIAVPVSCSKLPSTTATVAYPSLNPLRSNAPKPGDFTFRAERQIRFGPSQTIRPVRPSGIPTTIAPFVAFPSVPHGMPNKKRARPEDDEAENGENYPPATDGSPTKKLRMSIGQDVKPSTPRKTLNKFKPGSASSSAKKTLSLSRLNFLSRPKNRA